MKINLIKKITLTAGIAILFSAAAFGEKAPVYISPNNDGVQDELVVPLKIKEQRYVSEWSFIISNEKGEVVRVIGNKETRDEKITFKTFFKRLFTPKTGVTIPSEVTWNGYCDDGSLAKDGTYYYQFSATDDNGNSATTSRLTVIVDNTDPEVKITQLSDQDKTFGEGSKSSLKIVQTGSVENLWTATIYDATTKEVVRTYKWEKSAPLTFSWDGTNEEDNLVADGVYTYEINSTDAAGNKSEAASLTNIIYSAEKPVINIAISGSKYFSPNGDGKQDSVKLDLSIPKPASKANRLVMWKVEILDSAKKVVRTYTESNNTDGITSVPSVIEFDGKGDDSSLVTQTAGQYTAKVSARYLNGYEPAAVESPVFVLDNLVPEALVRATDSVFNGSSSLEITQQISKKEEDFTGAKNWTAKIVSTGGKVVKTFNFGDSIPSSVYWNGTDDSGKFAEDASYYYELSVTEPAGNSAVFKTSNFTLDTSKTELMLTARPEAFSPRIGKAITFTPVAKASSGIDSYTLTVQNSAGKTVRTLSGNGNLPATIAWDGNDDSSTRCADGTYTATLSTVAKSGTKAETKSREFTIDSIPPTVEISVPYLLFSPDGISTRQTIPVTATSSTEAKWTAEIRKSGNSSNVPAVKTITWNNSKVSNFAWDGTDENGNKAADGTYSITVSSTDAAGNSGSAVIDGIKLDKRETKVYITPELAGISPNNDGVKDMQRFTVKTTLSEGISSWNFKILDEKGNAVKEWSDKDSKDLPAIFNWAGDLPDGTAADGTYHAVMKIDYEKGNSCSSESSSFICTALPPQLNVQTRTADSGNWFSPDNDGVDDELYIRLKRNNNLAELKNWSFTIYDRNNNPFWKTSGKNSITERIIWDGRGNNGELVQSAEDYKYVFEAEDVLGMSNSVEGVISIDILVIRDGDKLKMQVPSIIFRSDNADFLTSGEVDSNGKKVAKGITKEQKANNEVILKRIATVLGKFKDYKVTVVGHANRLTDNPDEETVDNPSNWGPALIPLSQRRAEYVRDILVSYGVSADRLSVDGKGGTEPVADTKDRNVNWKNRRVEFILEK